MRTRTKIVMTAIIISLVVIPSVISAIQLTGASCNRVDIGFPINWHGYNCVENGGAIRGFQEPNAYDKMVAYYVPPLEQTTPDYTFVTGGQTGTLTVK